jgi:hypothetical protein
MADTRTISNLTFDHLKITQGRLDYFPYDWLKDLGGNNSGGMQNNAFWTANHSAGDSGLTVTDCYIANSHDFTSALSPPANISLVHNWFEGLQDDFCQWEANTNGAEIAYNVFDNCPMQTWSWQQSGSSTGLVYVHHNVAWSRRSRLYGINALGGPHNHSPTHGSTHNSQQQKIYNNTMVWASCAGDFGGGICLCHQAGYTDNGDASRPHEAYNNLVMIYDKGTHPVRFGIGQHDEAGFFMSKSGQNEIYDYNHYCRVLGYTPALSAKYLGRDHAGAPNNVGSTYLLSTISSVTSTLGQEAHGTEEEHVGVGSSGLAAASPLVDLEGLDFRPKSGSALVSGAKDLSNTGWPGATGNSWRGALDPNGDGTEVGPRA